MVEQLLIETNGARLAADRAGSGDPIIFLHAGVGDRRKWRPQTADLQEGWETFAYDRRGFGGTDSIDGPFSHTGDLLALMDALGMDTAVLAGCSQGGRVAIDFALAYPHRVRKLALLAPAVSGAPPPQALPPGIAALDAELDAADKAGDLQRINAIEAIFWLDGPAGPEGRVGGALRELFLDMNGIALRMSGLIQEIEPPPAFERVGELALPVLVLWGDRDFPHVIDRCLNLVDQMPGAQDSRIANAAHLFNMEQPAQVNALLKAFLEG